MFQENDVVKLSHAIDAGNASSWPGVSSASLPRGAIGTVVMVYQGTDGKAYEVEFVASDGATTALLTLSEDDLEPA